MFLMVSEASEPHTTPHLYVTPSVTLNSGLLDKDLLPKGRKNPEIQRRLEPRFQPPQKVDLHRSRLCVAIHEPTPLCVSPGSCPKQTRLGWRPSLFGWRLEAIASRLEAIAINLDTAFILTWVPHALDLALMPRLAEFADIFWVYPISCNSFLIMVRYQALPKISDVLVY